MKILVPLILMFAAPALAEVPTKQWTPAAKLSMAQCLVAESGWESRTEKIAIAHVLTKRWEAIVKGDRKATLASVVRRYCSMFKGAPTPRTAWLRALRWNDAMPAHLRGRSTGGQSYVALWQNVRRLVAELAAGQHPDPIPEAVHFGNEEDHAKRFLTGRLGRFQDLPRVLQGVEPERAPVALQNHFYARM